MNQRSDYHSLRSMRGNFSYLTVLSFLFFMVGTFAFASPTDALRSEYDIQQTITGTVVDGDGIPLGGANVLVKGTTTGTQTDFDGNFSIEADSDAVLVFSFVGFTPQEIPVNGQSVINVTMVEDAAQLSEVVVLGYASQTRGDVTGSVASVDVAEATKTPIVNASEALEGRVTGVTVTNAGSPGEAPKINIRGFGTSNNTNPLYIIDGVQTDNSNVLNSINPADIDQINVLKDGAAAIYGARASNGVVIITTKGGGYNQEEAIVSLNVYTGISRAVNTPELLNAQQHGEMIFQSLANDGATLTHPQYGDGPSPVVPNTLQGYTRVVSYDPITREPVTATVRPGGTDWIDAITQDAQTQNVSLSIQNGGETGKYFMSANYLNREGIFLTTGFKQGTTRLNSEFKIGDRIIIGEHLNASFSNRSTGNTVQDALRMSPLIPVYDDEGNFAGTGGPGLSNTRSPVAQLLRGDDNYNKLFRVFGDVYLQANVYEGLTLKTLFSGTVESGNNRSFLALDPEFIEPLSTNTLTEFTFNNFSWTWSNTANYANSFGDHNINVLAGIEAVQDRSKGSQISRNGYLFETPDFYLLSNGSGTPNVDFAYDGENALFSVFGTATYSYAGKYFGTATIRRDESSRFLGDNKSDIFPSFSAGWLISDEDFFPQDGWVSRLKLKASYGQLGNQTLPTSNPTINISSLNEGLANYSLDGSSISTGAILDQVGNPNLRWETSEVKNLGVDLGMFDNTLNISFEVYDKDTKDLITRDFSLISTTAIDATAPLVNLGDIQNTGFDLGIGYANETSYGLQYNISANISQYKNEVKNLISDFQVGRTNLRGGAVTRTEVGRAISEFYGREVIGFTDEGRFEYRDVDGDGTIDDDDRTYIGSPHPDFVYGLNVALNYKGFDMSLFISGSQGNDVYNYDKIFTDFPTFFNSNRSVRVLDSWTPSNTDATLPALSQSITNSETQPNSFFVEDASFMRLKNLQVGYTFPDDIAATVGMDMLRLYVQGTNLFTITGYDGFDPEIITFDNLSLGIDENTFPLSQIFTIGINTKF
ncbi:TonB-dependent receptor [Zeaxanthinibacter sp. PT1]|uniref:SusC/RagA family TonB-linked outer membrane protein n=1 Tax=Zeaxanthinibacter TaxID=561554 RepID=UPI00234AA4E4|nr:TonB-dependent receptor [Zeaxanthinibacter sp. PT1]MDC6352730.1 TonB-dependent receptor [Zeaxanthinibacter sp. PT1]